MRRGVFPGSFDPLTVAHVAIADAAHAQCGLDELVLVVSVDPLGKAAADQLTVDHRLAAIAKATGDRPWLHAAATDKRLLVDIAAGFDVLVLGADKWAQVIDPAFYADAQAAADAVRRLPPLAVAGRLGLPVPDGATLLVLPPWIGAVSSTAVRSGREDWRATRG